jgi:hypothetical protein
MTSHHWGDKDFDWKALNDACRFFAVNLRRYGRMFVLTKEKYGTLRLEFLDIGMGRVEIGTLFFNRNWLYIHSKKIYAFDKAVTKPIARFLRLNTLLRKYQRLVFNLVTLRACQKWPHIKAEILDEYEFKELLYSWVKNKVGYVCNWTNSCSTDDVH